jgi:hypothetical protein
MNERDNGGSAFPEVRSEYSEWAGHGGALTSVYSEGGMTLRDYFAAQAMAAIIGKMELSTEESLNSKPTVYENHRQVARGAYAFADAMLSERAK